MLKIIFLFLNIPFAVAFALASCAGWFDPQEFSVVALFGLSYPLLLAINIFFTLFWIICWKKYFWLSFLLFFVKVDNIPLYIQYGGNDELVEDAERLTILNYNIHDFSYQAETREHQLQQIESILGFVEQVRPDIICFQEFTSHRSRQESPHQRLIQMGYVHHINGGKKGELFVGNAIYTKLPMIKKEWVFPGLRQEKRFLYGDILWQGDTLRMFNLHLASYHLEQEDAEIFQRMRNPESFDKHESKKFLAKLIKAYTRRAEEVNLMKEMLEKSPYENVVCGDFNDTPVSYAYRNLSKNLSDTFREQGDGFGTTFIGPFPSNRIDYVLIPKSYQTVSFRSKPNPFSDHISVIAQIVKKK